MTKYLICNENGDWWEIDYEKDVGQTLFAIPTASLEMLLIDESEVNSQQDIYSLDKLEDRIRKFGRPLYIEPADLE